MFLHRSIKELNEENSRHSFRDEFVRTEKFFADLLDSKTHIAHLFLVRRCVLRSEFVGLEGNEAEFELVDVWCLEKDLFCRRIGIDSERDRSIDRSFSELLPSLSLTGPFASLIETNKAKFDSLRLQLTNFCSSLSFSSSSLEEQIFFSMKNFRWKDFVPSLNFDEPFFDEDKLHLTIAFLFKFLFGTLLTIALLLSLLQRQIVTPVNILPALNESFAFPLLDRRETSFVVYSKQEEEEEQRKVCDVCSLFSSLCCWSWWCHSVFFSFYSMCSFNVRVNGFISSLRSPRSSLHWRKSFAEWARDVDQRDLWLWWRNSFARSTFAVAMEREDRRETPRSERKIERRIPSLQRDTKSHRGSSIASQSASTTGSRTLVSLSISSSTEPNSSRRSSTRRNSSRSDRWSNKSSSSLFRHRLSQHQISFSSNGNWKSLFFRSSFDVRCPLIGFLDWINPSAIKPSFNWIELGFVSFFSRFSFLWPFLVDRRFNSESQSKNRLSFAWRKKWKHRRCSFERAERNGIDPSKWGKTIRLTLRHSSDVLLSSHCSDWFTRLIYHWGSIERMRIFRNHFLLLSHFIDDQIILCHALCEECRNKLK